MHKLIKWPPEIKAGVIFLPLFMFIKWSFKPRAWNDPCFQISLVNPTGCQHVKLCKILLTIWAKWLINSLAPGRYGFDFDSLATGDIVVIDFLGISMTIPLSLTHWGLVTHICVSRLDHHYHSLAQIIWCVAHSAPSHYLDWLGQLERLRSEISPAAPWLPILVIHIRSHVIKRQSQIYKFPKFAENSMFRILQ